MRYLFYAIKNQIFAELEPLISNYNKCVKDIFNPEIKERLQLIREKSELQEKVEKLLKEQICIGVMDEVEYEISVKPHIKSQLINKVSLYELAMIEDDKSSGLYEMIRCVMLKDMHMFIWVR